MYDLLTKKTSFHYFSGPFTCLWKLYDSLKVYHLVFTIFALKLKACLSRNLGSHQKACIPQRYMSECPCSNYNIIQHAKQNNLSGLVVLVDFNKAFDRASFEFINTFLKMFGLRPFFTNQINILIGNTPGGQFTSLNIVNNHETGESNLYIFIFPSTLHSGMFCECYSYTTFISCYCDYISGCQIVHKVQQKPTTNMNISSSPWSCQYFWLLSVDNSILPLWKSTFPNHLVFWYVFVSFIYL